MGNSIGAIRSAKFEVPYIEILQHVLMSDIGLVDKICTHQSLKNGVTLSKLFCYEVYCQR